MWMNKDIIYNARQKPHRPTWAEIDLSAIKYNFDKIRKLIKRSTHILAAVKANAYGHGIMHVSKTLAALGVDYLGVGTTDEALGLRQYGIDTPVLILGAILSSEAAPNIKNNISFTVSDAAIARAIDRSAKRLKRKAKVHLKIDTGMGRIGVWHEEAFEFVKHVYRFSNIEIEGIFSHFPSADKDPSFTRRQISYFGSLIRQLERSGIYIRYKHMANSAAIMDYKDSHMNLIRPGIMLYGLYPDRKRRSLVLKPAMALKSRIVFIKDAEPGRSISYGGTYITKRKTKIATVPIGYGDGFNRRLSNKGYILIGGKKRPVIGSVCMDQIMVDITNLPDARVGDEVVIIGNQSGKNISIEETALLCKTIPYEVACWLDNNRIPRIYK
jgi:alanine racemase